ncbi:MAG TPA: tRNA pseudouridine(38-40) synthase TruA [Ktedonobacterales bacterium]|jgi:tRNA pseudouridine38-40 synthase|nr:tRNA pseudouridine(38-40) synthase TruA [Ktedonobacterales bacterium]
MPAFAALVTYDGARFSGFQRQSEDKGPTVQGALEAVLERLTGAATAVTAAGRTDSGVHATGQVIGFVSAAEFAPATWRRAFNALLPEDVAIRAVCAVGDDFHARRSALSRRYSYRILCDLVRSPLAERYAWRRAGPLDVEAMDRAAQTLLGEHDFGAFGSSPRDSRADGFRGRTVRTMLAAGCHVRPGSDLWQGDGEMIECIFAANAFLTGMARRLVGTLVLVGEGRLSVEEFVAILVAREKAHPGAAAPAKGLCLTSAEYPAGMVSWHSED